jgi:peptidoglycan/xylan/chitin deacetylase (PgdA/CDA1 family)
MTLHGPRIYGLMYHDVISGTERSGRHGDGPERYKLSPPDFLAHLTAMERAVEGRPLAVGSAPAPGQSGWALTFDDGGSSGLAVAEELARRGWLAYFFITSDAIGRPGFLDREAIRDLDRLGHVVGSHSTSHPSPMSTLSYDALVREWAESAAELAEIVGKPVKTASVPGGDYRSHVGRAAAQAGIELLFTSEPVRRARFQNGCLVAGRYSIRRHTSAREAASAAAGDAGLWLRQWSAWNARKPVKLMAGRHYDRLRSSMLKLRSGTSNTTDA